MERTKYVWNNEIDVPIHLAFIIIVVFFLGSMKSILLEISIPIYIINGLGLTCFSILLGFIIFNDQKHKTQKIKCGVMKYIDKYNEINMRNKRLMKEYKDIAEFYNNEIMLDDYQNSEKMRIIQNNPNMKFSKNYKFSDADNNYGNKLKKYDWLAKSINRINERFIFANMITLLQGTDILENKNGIVCCNINSLSLSCKRDRTIEKIFHNLDQNEIQEFFKKWDQIDKVKYFLEVSTLPYEWIIYEYRKIFGNIYVMEFFRDSYKNFKNEFFIFEKNVINLKKSHDIMYGIIPIKNETLLSTERVNNFCKRVFNMGIYMIDIIIATSISILFNFHGSLLIPCVLLLTAYCSLLNAIKSTIKYLNDEERIETDSIQNMVINEITRK
jgi:hypothetical protein